MRRRGRLASRHRSRRPARRRGGAGSVRAAVERTAACIPALVYAAIVLRLDRYEIEPLRAVLACFTWGAVGAILFSVATGLLFQFAVEETLGAEATTATSVVIGAPLVEEVVQGNRGSRRARLCPGRDRRHARRSRLRRAGRRRRDDREHPLLRSGLSRGLGEFGTLVLGRAVVGGFGHPAYTAITGAAIGWSRGRYGRGLPG